LSAARYGAACVVVVDVTTPRDVAVGASDGAEFSDADETPAVAKDMAAIPAAVTRIVEIFRMVSPAILVWSSALPDNHDHSGG